MILARVSSRANPFGATAGDGGKIVEDLKTFEPVLRAGVDREIVTTVPIAEVVDGEGHFHGPGPWPFHIHAYAGREDNDLVLWLPSIHAIVTGDSLSDFGHGLDIQLGGRKHVTRDDVAQRLRPLLNLPVEIVLPAHGLPTDRAALELALS